MNRNLPIYDPAGERAWSKSSLGTLLETCSWQWYLDKVAGVLPYTTTPANAIGTAFHAAVELHETLRIRARREGRPFGGDFVCDRATLDAEAARVFDLEWAKVEPELAELHEFTYEEASALAYVCIDNWWDELRPTLLGYFPLMVEPYVAVPHDASRRGIHGYIDWVGWDPVTGMYVVIDWKTAKSFGRWAHGGEGHEVEAGLYLDAARRARWLGINGPIRMEWWIARKGKGTRSNFERTRVVTSDLTVEEGNRVLSDALVLADQKADGYGFAQNPDSFLCSPKWCPAWDHCMGDGDAWTPEVLLGVGG